MNPASLCLHREKGKKSFSAGLAVPVANTAGRHDGVGDSSGQLYGFTTASCVGSA